MSGGYFEYQQYRIDDIVRELDHFLDKHHRGENEEWDDYSDSVIDEMETGLDILKIASIYAQRIDWLLSGDDGEESFLRRLKEELSEVKLNNIKL